MGTFDEVIAELKTRRDKITVAIEALEELSGGTSNESSVRENERIQEILEDGPQASGAIIACLKVGGLRVSDASVYTGLNAMKAKGMVVRSNDGVWSLAK